MGKYATLLVSRQPLRPCGRTSWVEAVSRAIEWLAEHDTGLVASAGMQTWELPLALSSWRGLPMRIVLPHRDYSAAQIELRAGFDLSASRCRFLPLEGTTSSDDRHALMQRRDTTVVNLADWLVPISLRPGGNMSRLVAVAQGEGKPVERRFTVPHRATAEPRGYVISTDALKAEIKAVGSDFITHWTRTPNGPWPGERLLEYYLAVLGSGSYPRSALDTLRSILDGRLIRASSAHMPGRIATVSFSSLPPSELAALMRWRSRYRQMSFEPYGVGIKAETACRMGIQQVQYYDPSHDIDIPARDCWRFQSIGRKADWRLESEWRHRGDFDFSSVPKDDLVVFCRFSEEAALVEREFGITARAFVRES